MSDPVSTISILIIGFIAFIFILALFLRYPIGPVVLVLSVFAVETFFIDGMPPIKFGSFNISLQDALSTMLLIASFINLALIKSHVTRTEFLLLGMGGLLIISLVRGFTQFGVEPAVRYFRNYLYFYSTTLAIIFLYRATINLKSFLLWWNITAWVLISLTVARLGLVAFGTYQNYYWVAAGGLMSRVITAAPTLVLLQASILIWIISRNRVFSSSKLLFFLALPIIIILQHRTIWIIMFFVFLLIFLMERRLSGFALFAIMSTALLFTITLLLFWDNSLLGSVAGSAQNANTFNWRIEGWRQLLLPERFKSFIDYAIGQPFGTGYTRFLFGSRYATEFSPHNFYIQTFLNIGGVGLTILIAVYARTLGRLLANRQDRVKLAFALVLISQLLFFITYSPNIEQGLLLGFSILVSKNGNFPHNDG
jgi:hypothetical protein